jgi:uncharacterized protein (TIGR02646 family)
MIRIERGPSPVFLTDPEGPWCKETDEAIRYYADPANTKAFRFEMYNDERLKEALRAVFTKCAYCESKYAGTSDGDIEHFRPKGRVMGKNPETPGYYWLANDWDNLLLSCQHCNQGRKHRLYDQIDGEGNKKVGKVDQFPLLAPGMWTSAPHGALTAEEPYRLLLNPCIDNPEDHFEYLDTHALMVPKTEMAKKSIEVYALRRRFLVQERKEVLSNILVQLNQLKYVLENFNQNPEQRHKDALIRCWDTIKGFTAAEARYAGMARFFVKKFLVKNQLYVPA